MVINSRNVWSQMNSNYVVTAAVSCDDLPFFAFALNFSSLKKLNDVIRQLQQKYGTKQTVADVCGRI